MAILLCAELEGGAEEQRIAQLLDPMRLYPGFICQAAGPVAGGYQTTGLSETQEKYVRWLRGVNPRSWSPGPTEEALP